MQVSTINVVALSFLAFRWAYLLHPDRELAMEIAAAAVDAFLREEKTWSQHLSKLSSGNDIGKKSNRIPLLSQEERLLKQVFIKSIRWEDNQLNSAPPLNPIYNKQMRLQKYVPTADDLLVRYVKGLLLHAMGKRSVHAAIGLGCFLWGYRQDEILRLGGGYLWGKVQAPSIAGQVGVKAVHPRFKDRKDIFHPSIGNHTQTMWWSDPTLSQVLNRRSCHSGSREYQLIQRFLQEIVPPLSFPQKSVADFLNDDFLSLSVDLSDEAENRRFWLLVGAVGVGIEKLIDQFNKITPVKNDCLQPPPQDNMRIPVFQITSPKQNPPNGGANQSGESGSGPKGPNSSNGSGSNRFDRFSPQIENLLLVQQPKRRENFHAHSPLWVEVDGEKVGTLTQPCSLTVPADAHSIEVWGEDDQGALLLAVFPLELLESEPTRSFGVTIEGGKEVSIHVGEVTEEEISLSLSYKDLQVPVDVNDVAKVANEPAQLRDEVSSAELSVSFLSTIGEWFKPLTQPPLVSRVLATALVILFIESAIIGSAILRRKQDGVTFHDDPSAAVPFQYPQLEVIFLGKTTFKEAHELLLEPSIKGSISAGPKVGVDGEYVCFVTIEKVVSDEELRQIAQRLRNRADLIKQVTITKYLRRVSQEHKGG